jgi:thiol-disulfide isomerase/thioredoxin
MFSIINVADSTVFSRNELKKKKPVIIILFNPDCSHCIHFTKELLASYDLFKETQFVMISSLDHHLIKKFYEENKISNYPNIHMGRDGNFFLGTFYKPKNYPAIYIYDKKRNFVKSFDGDATIPKIAEALRN